MDEFTRDYVHGQAGLGKIEAGMSGDMREAALWAAVEEATDDRPRRYERSSGRSGSKVPILVFALIVIVLLVLFL